MGIYVSTSYVLTNGIVTCTASMKCGACAGLHVLQQLNSQYLECIVHYSTLEQYWWAFMVAS